MLSKIRLRGSPSKYEWGGGRDFQAHDAILDTVPNAGEEYLLRTYPLPRTRSCTQRPHHDRIY